VGWLDASGGVFLVPPALFSGRWSPVTTYTADDIEVLEGLAAVRKVPGMYIGATDARGVQHMCWEVIDNAVDEAIAGHCSLITVVVHTDGSVSVADNGRGIPTGVNKATGVSSLELVFTKLHAGGKFSGAGYKVSGGLHGVGASVVNALSAKLEVEVDRDGKTFAMSFQRGTPGVFTGARFEAQPGVRTVRGAKPSTSGTRVRFWPDPEIFAPGSDVDVEGLCRRARTTTHLVDGLSISIVDERSGERFMFEHQPLSSLVAAVAPKPLLHDPIVAAADRTYTTTTQATDESGVLRPVEVERSMRVDVAFAWCDSDEPSTVSFVNIVTTTSGTHVAGFERAVVKAVGDLVAQHRPKRGPGSTEDVERADILEGLVAVVSVKFPEPRFESQTKEKLSTPAASKIVADVTAEAFTRAFASKASARLGKLIADKALTAARVRTQMRERKETLRRKTALTSSSLPAKLADCRSDDVERTELFLVEGDSAMGTGKAARDASFQALLPLRGKVLNTWRANEKKMLDNAECAAIISAVGAGSGNHFSLDAVRYGKVVLLVDADVDGSHIRSLLITFFCSYMRPLVAAGRLFAAVPPLHKITLSGSGDVFYTYSEAERLAKVADLTAAGRTIAEIQRYKGLGEMDAQQLAETTLEPARRALRRITLDDWSEAESTLELLMGSKVEPRRDFILERAAEVDWGDLDV
jgi:DNA gyrase subunit B